MATYRIIVTNNGPAAAAGATVADVFGPALRSPSWTCSASAGSTCGAASGAGNIATTVTLAVGGTATFTATALIVPVAVVPLVNTATVTPPAGITDPNPADNSSTSSVAVTPLADVQVTKSGPARTTPGSPLVYTITVTNAGPSDAVAIRLLDPTPPGTTLVGTSFPCGIEFPCLLGGLVPGESVTVTATYRLAPPVRPHSTITNVATATSLGTPDPNEANNTATAVTSIGRIGCDVNGDGFDEIVTGAGPGGGPHVRVLSLAGGTLIERFGYFAYSPAFPGGVTVACGDVDGDGLGDVITGAGPGGGPLVRAAGLGIFQEFAGFFAYDPAFGGGVNVAVGDVTGDGIADVITGAGPGGGPHVRVFSLAGGALTDVAGFFAYDSGFPGGVHVAAGDLDGDGVDEIITGAGPGGGPHVRVFKLAGGVLSEMAGLFAYDPRFPGGVYVAAGDTDGDGIDELITGAGPGGGPHVRVFRLSGGTLQETAGFFAYDPAFPGGVSVGAADVDGDGTLEIVTGAGAGGGPHVRVLHLAAGTLSEVASFFAYDPRFPGGVSVASASQLHDEEDGRDAPPVGAQPSRRGGVRVALVRRRPRRRR